MWNTLDSFACVCLHVATLSHKLTALAPVAAAAAAAGSFCAACNFTWFLPSCASYNQLSNGPGMEKWKQKKCSSQIKWLNLLALTASLASCSTSPLSACNSERDTFICVSCILTPVFVLVLALVCGFPPPPPQSPVSAAASCKKYLRKKCYHCTWLMTGETIEYPVTCSATRWTLLSLSFFFLPLCVLTRIRFFRFLSLSIIRGLLLHLNIEKKLINFLHLGLKRQMAWTHKIQLSLSLSLFVSVPSIVFMGHLAHRNVRSFDKKQFHLPLSLCVCVNWKGVQDMSTCVCAISLSSLCPYHICTLLAGSVDSFFLFLLLLLLLLSLHMIHPSPLIHSLLRLILYSLRLFPVDLNTVNYLHLALCLSFLICLFFLPLIMMMMRVNESTC